MRISGMIPYDTITETINDLKERGYKINFNVGFNGALRGGPSVELSPDNFAITEVHRFEGETDPGDLAVVYAIESQDGHKGVLVNGYGVSSDVFSDDLIRKLPIKF